MLAHYTSYKLHKLLVRGCAPAKGKAHPRGSAISPEESLKAVSNEGSWTKLVGSWAKQRGFLSEARLRPSNERLAGSDRQLRGARLMLIEMESVHALFCALRYASDAPRAAPCAAALHSRTASEAAIAQPPSSSLLRLESIGSSEHFFRRAHIT